MAKADITFETAIAALDEDRRKLVTALHSNALALGYTPFIAKAGSKPGNYKIEYKADKASYVLFITRISKGDISIGCKLLHLGKYANLIDELSETTRHELLTARPCKTEKGCTGYIHFNYESKEYFTCRHAMRLKTLTHSDAQSFWSLLAHENRFRQEEQIRQEG